MRCYGAFVFDFTRPVTRLSSGLRNNVVNYLKLNWLQPPLHGWCEFQFSLLDFGFPTVRNYFEASQAKYPAKGAGPNLKHEANMAVIRREVVIQNAKDLLEFAKAYLGDHRQHGFSLTLSSLRDMHSFINPSMTDTGHIACLRRRKTTVYSILANSHERNFKIRKLSCYCEKGLFSVYEDCLSPGKDLSENWEQIEFESERVERRATLADMNEQRERIVWYPLTLQWHRFRGCSIYTFWKFWEMGWRLSPSQLGIIGVEGTIPFEGTILC